MSRIEQAGPARAFRARHHTRPILLLPNVWDGLSARLFVTAGFDTLATTSAGVAWALGYPDGEIAPWAEIVAATRRIVRVAGAPVTADIEAGYGATPVTVAAHVAGIIDAGVVGINLEDSANGRLRSLDDAVARISAAREADDESGVPTVINARCDAFFIGHGDLPGRFSVAVERCRAYVAAGADCTYPFGLRETDSVAAFVKAVAAPVNVTGRPGMPDAAAFERIGVARITIALAPTLVAMAAVKKLATELRASGSFDSLAAPLYHPDAQELFQSGG